MAPSAFVPNIVDGTENFKSKLRVGFLILAPLRVVLR